MRDFGGYFMPFSPNQHEEKPYNACIDCVHLGKNCDGPNFLAMTPERFGEWVKLRKQYKGWSVEDLAERSGVSESSLKRIIWGKANDLKLTTMQAITEVLVDGSWGQYPCAWAASTGALDNDADHLKDALAREKEAVVTLKEQLAKKDKQLDERRDFIYKKDAEISELKQERKGLRRISAVLSFLLAVTLVYITFTLIIDYRNPYRGFWWMEDGVIGAELQE